MSGRGFSGKIPGMLDTTAAWLAALIDGEGSIMLSRRTYSGNTARTAVPGRASYRPVVVVAANTDPRLFEAIRTRLGVGQVYEHAVNGDPARARRRRQWSYRLNVGQIKDVLPHVRPWLVLKGEQADLLAEAMQIKEEITPGARGFLPANRPPLLARLDEIYLAIRAANTRGRKVTE